MYSSALEDVPQHVHLSNHPGHNLKRPQEFFQIYGDYVLRVLQMIKRGYTSNEYDVPSLDNFKILWNCDPNLIGSHVSKDNIRSLVAKAIAYLQELSPPKWTSVLGLSRSQSAIINAYLDVQDGDSEESNLYRYIDSDQIVFWKCQAHAHQYLNLDSLERLQEFSCGHGGYVDMQKAWLSVKLRSSIEADQFCFLLKATKHTFDISINLSWEVTRSCVWELCMDIADTGTVVLELDGITPDILPQGHEQYFGSLLSDDILEDNELQQIILLNYPRPQEQCIHFKFWSLQSPILPARFHPGWVKLRYDMNNIIANVVSTPQQATELTTATTDIRSVLEMHKLSNATVLTIYCDWTAVLDLEEGTIVSVFSSNFDCPKDLLSSGSLRELTLHLEDTEFDKDFFLHIADQLWVAGTQHILSRAQCILLCGTFNAYVVQLLAFLPPHSTRSHVRYSRPSCCTARH